MKIAFVGLAGSGKSTLASYLARKYGLRRHSFATKVKYFASKVLNRSTQKPLDRTFLQMLGDGARHSDSLVWIHWLNKVMAQDILYYKKRGFVIDDCRYMNESVWLKKAGFIVIRVVGRGYNLEPENAAHPSETEQSFIVCDFELDNSGKIEDVCKKLEVIVCRT